ncbi:MAG: LysM peptidoglycan-binding domain-containing protein [Gammaproteobacteria bacterium]|nr:LysM peptidoglycan-binding domain-containing protein [Gammaproteobacteria bacterium]MBL6998769.1 LysM peptidoglycan-binding domain-containing protein [Gammaproteobacteria bacterium]
MAGSEYTVVSGDNLWNISAKDSTYGNPYQWPLIYKANSNQIKDADLIYAGQVFSIPSASSSEVDAAIQHAKTRGAWSIGEVEATDKDFLAR